MNGNATVHPLFFFLFEPPEIIKEKYIFYPLFALHGQKCATDT